MIKYCIRANLRVPKIVVVEVACAAVIGCNAIAAWEIGVEKFIHVLADDDVRVKEDTDVVIC